MVPFPCLRSFMAETHRDTLSNNALTDRCDVGESVRDQHPAVLVLHPLEQLEHRVLHVRHQHRLLWGRVALPPGGGDVIK